MQDQYEVSPRLSGAALCAGLLALGGCLALPGERFTLQADLPANFKFSGDAYYAPAQGQNCASPGAGSSLASDRKYFDTDYQPEAHRVEFQVPLTARAGGCALVLSSMRIDLEGKWGERRLDIGGDYASLSFRDGLPADSSSMPTSGEKVFPGQCTWLFRTAGSQRYIVKVLQCRGLDDQGQVLKRLPGGALQREQLAGQTVRLVIGLAQEERPYFGRSWLKTSSGWKPCLETKESFRCQAPPTFTDFKMPDGRTCTVYPNCTE
ncbi:hypothetical protein VUJ49_21105 [Pseudomonas berkeleyensis]|uniref:Uncharacterized protein n=1 Tax=Pseudomonas berkeleyensis TaxID=2726956 RepID=A0A7G5DL59_9PSED|nr:hypothetical protein [Pseudomonas berkeleyensis]QMV62484.1 hypothetical protein HS968_21010 [Pseudomonas berkeleyensis]WSO37931.1 hypothetical protein VUJ49_21105 [Pseudomonas berkeleyensis]